MNELLRAIVSLPRPLLLAFDVDGTIAPIVKDPEAAKIPKTIQKALKELNQASGFSVAFITGRDARSLSKMMNFIPFYVAYQHGRFIKKAGEDFSEYVEEVEVKKKLANFSLKVEKRFKNLPMFAEMKEGAIAFHVRQLHAVDLEKSVFVLNEIKTEAEKIGLVVRAGKMVCEVESYASNEMLTDKGKALERIQIQTASKSVFFVGDDVTDFPAIEFAESLPNGIGVFVNSDEMKTLVANNELKPKARAYFDSTEQVQHFIQCLCNFSSSN